MPKEEAEMRDELAGSEGVAGADASQPERHSRSATGEGAGSRADSSTSQHHLHYDRYKGWILRVTVQVGTKVIGKRLKFRLRTHDLAEAQKARELVIGVLRRLGLTVRVRMQRPVKIGDWMAPGRRDP
ncbi:hypothetical protein OKA05_28580 [Luteolibacter arcticus]|uniref:Uncharacterized protein n=1 Tax=Luteolibacter arcticus TaxID=1581411 RepID=A0ABT3GST1_9BACT|nr:hypothetical protein [Luteolibacter arcticus]MCW1926542.1 hypothetical protein [Luteolibacter arcticus]